MDDQERLIGSSGGDAPDEWDEKGNAIRYKTVVTLKKKEGEEKNTNGAAKAKIYDIARLKLEKFHMVLHFLYSTIKHKVVTYT